jgi:autotransporter strand-loop-strand O-heptosyltransferase
MTDPRPVPVPTQAGPHGIRYDFNAGLRVALPPGDWRVRFRDLDTDTILFDQKMTGGMVTSSKQYFVRFGLEVWKDGVSIFTHHYSAANREVLIQMDLGGLGDHLAWIGHAQDFADKHHCKLTVCVRPVMVHLLAPAYPGITFVADGEGLKLERFYATYKICIVYEDTENKSVPTDYRIIGLCQMAAYILGLPPVERRPSIAIDNGGPPISGPYVCIAAQASSQNKYWNNPHGWAEVVAYLKAEGYRVICIDRETTNGKALVWNHIPFGAEDQTGNRPLTERARWLRHASFFIGLSSGLSWVAWAAGTPVVMISGFTHPVNEFYTPYRVINFHTCNSCSNDPRHRLDTTDYFWCPRHKDTPRQFECTRLISAGQVKQVLQPLIKERPAKPAAAVGEIAFA